MPKPTHKPTQKPAPSRSPFGRLSRRRKRSTDEVRNVSGLGAALRRWVRQQLASAGYVYFKTSSPEYYAQDSLFTTNNDAFRRRAAFREAYARGLKACCG